MLFFCEAYHKNKYNDSNFLEYKVIKMLRVINLCKINIMQIKLKYNCFVLYLKFSN